MTTLKRKLIIYSGLTVLFPLLILLSLFVLYKGGFSYLTIFSENFAIYSSYFVLFTFGGAGIFFSILSLYHSFLNLKIWKSLLLNVFCYFPFMLISVFFLYAGFILTTVF